MTWSSGLFYPCNTHHVHSFILLTTLIMTTNLKSTSAVQSLIVTKTRAHLICDHPNMFNSFIRIMPTPNSLPTSQSQTQSVGQKINQFSSIGTSISVGGFLHRVKRTATKNSILFFHVDVTNIPYITDRTHFQDTKK